MDNIFRYSYMRYEKPVQSEYFTHMHNDYELLFFLDGDADYIIGSSVYNLEKNDLLLIKPLTYHHLQLNSDAPYERIHFNFTRSEVIQDVLPLLLDENAPCVYHIPQDHPIRGYFDELIANQNYFSETEFGYFKHFALNVILMHLSHISPGISKSAKATNHEDNRILRNIVQYINDNPEKAITIKELSERFFMSSSWIVHTFKDHLRISITQYINRRRILHAQKLILSGIAPEKAAKLCYYETYTTFYRQYKKILERSPVEDRPLKEQDNPATPITPPHGDFAERKL